MKKKIRTKWNPALCMCVYLRQVYRNRVRVRLGTGQFIYKTLNLQMLEDVFCFFYFPYLPSDVIFDVSFLQLDLL